ncbi:MAG: hypothetical protein EXR79_07870 [Myxococcales bacterium]|nr:hypothetical protein [Myxococcales bacterium]
MAHGGHRCGRDGGRPSARDAELLLNLPTSLPTRHRGGTLHVPFQEAAMASPISGNRFAAAVLTAVLLPVAATAATLPVQGILRTSNGGPAADGAYVVFFRLFDAADAKAPVWEESIDVTIAGGFFAETLGGIEGKTIPEALLTAGKPLWLAVKVGTDPELAKLPLGWVPRAWYAKQAAGLQCTGCVGTDALADGAVTSAKVGFAYAGSDSKGGAAKEALTAKSAELAENAKNAKSAEFANVAKNADSAASADEAKTLGCKGCVGLNHLAADVANSFLSVKGGAVTGTLGVAGKLDLGDSPIQGGQFAGVDVKAATCGGTQVGRVVLDTTTKRLYFCDGLVWRRISSCLGQCKAAKDAACGAPIADDCGDVGACTGSGSACADGKTCSGGKCVGKPGETLESAAKNCKEVLAGGQVASGLYWLDTDGLGSGAAPFQAYCDQATDGGGWTRCGWIDEVAGGSNVLIIKEGAVYLDHAKLQNASFCGKWYSEQAPVEMMIHNLTKGADYGEDHKLKIRWGNKPFKLYTYDNHPLQSCENLTTGAKWSGCLYAAHSGWEDTSFSFTVNGMQNGYGGTGQNRLILGPTAAPGGNKYWHNFGADSNARNAANDWSGGQAQGYLYMR